MSTTQERKRFRRRTWTVTKPHLPKYSSVPELQLLPQRRPQFHCQRCGFTNTLIPLCLWCTWTSEEAEHEFELSMPRARRASAPPRVFFNNGPYPTHVRPHDQKNASASSSGRSIVHATRTNLFSKRNPQCPPLHVVPSRIIGTHIAVVHEELPLDFPDDCDRDTVSQAFSSSTLVTSEELRWLQKATETEHADRGGVAKVTQEPLPPPILSAEGSQNGDGLPVRSPGATNVMIDLRDPLRPPSPTLLPLSVERSKSEPMKTLKSSRRLLIIGLHDSKMPSPHEDDRPTLINKYDSPNYNDTKASSPVDACPPQHFRTLRRKKPLNASIPNPSATEPISISLTLHSTPSKRDMAAACRPDSPTRPFKAQSHPQSVSTDSSDPTTPPMTPTHLPSIGPPAAEPTKSPGSSPVRLGHPSRPYYTAIRKGGISPSPSRPSSISGPSPSSSMRPQSYQPPPSFQSGTSLGGTNATSTTARHLSMSAMFVAPSFSPSSQGMFSAFSVMDIDSDNLHRDDDNTAGDEEDEDELLPILPPTPAPSRFSFSLPRDVHRVARKAAAKSSTPHSHSQSLSNARSKARGSGMGFSMSGETELRMALAAGAAETGVAEDGFRFRETVMPLAAANSSLAAPGNTGGDGDVFGRGRTTNSKDSARKGHRSESFMGRLRRLRKGFKEMLVMNNTPTPTTPTTTPI